MDTIHDWIPDKEPWPSKEYVENRQRQRMEQQEKEECQKLYDTVVYNLDEINNLIQDTVGILMIALLKGQVESLKEIAIAAIKDKYK